MLFTSGMNPTSLSNFLCELKHHTFDLDRLAYFRSFLSHVSAPEEEAAGGKKKAKEKKKKKKKSGPAFGAGAGGRQSRIDEAKAVPVTAETYGICWAGHGPVDRSPNTPKNVACHSYGWESHCCVVRGLPWTGSFATS